jgi:spore maturation protein CgeB
MKKVILVAGSLDPAKSYEFHNFQKPLENLGHHVVPFDFVALKSIHNKFEINSLLLAAVREHRPDIVLFVPHRDEFNPEVIDEIGRLSITLGYYFDDTWRIDYSRFWARHFKFVTTSDVHGLRKFEDAGVTNVIFSPFACNVDVYSKRDLPKLYDVTFIGQYHPFREWTLNYLRNAGISVCAWGMGWPKGMVDTEEMINIFNQSRINLNMSNCVCWDARYLSTPFRPLKTTLRVWRQVLHALTRPDMKVGEMVKGRYYEVCATGGFQLAHYAEGLERAYTLGEEVAIYLSPEDMLEKVRYYLAHEEEREAIANKGYLRTLSDHTMEKRFQAIFQKLGQIKNQ